MESSGSSGGMEEFDTRGVSRRMFRSEAYTSTEHLEGSAMKVTFRACLQSYRQVTSQASNHYHLFKLGRAQEHFHF